MRIILGLLAVLTAFPAFAQTAPPPAAPPTGAPQGNIEERARRQLSTPSERDRQDSLMTGDTDILLLRRTPLFTLTASGDVTYTSNAALSPTDVRADGIGQASLGLMMGTRIGGKVDLFASAALVGVRYFDTPALNYNAFSGAVGARASFGRLSVSATYQPSMVWSGDFGRRQLTSHRFRFGAALPFRIQSLTVEPELHGERAITAPGFYSAWSAGGSLTVSRRVGRRAPVFLYAQIGYDRRSFDDYFAAFVGTRRLDDSLSAGAGVVWRPGSWGELRAAYNFGRNWSTSDVNGFTAHSGTLGLTATLRF
ncbi:hypothetical protein [Novosphingobium sp.]|uniref:hypothetical protein n=1 Tax=Novosphingobium sp. TaxID=1874826 RepID=UPI003BAB3ABE